MTPEQASELRAARMRSLRNMRRGVIAASLSAFVLAWGVIAHTGSRGAQDASASSSSSTSASSSSDGWSQRSSQTWSDSGQGSPDQGSGGVTTAQS